MKRICFIVLYMICSMVFASPLKNIVIFGDSLSDNGNLYEYMKHQLPVSPPYYEGRFTNGPVWVERLAASYFSIAQKDKLLDYAYGGAGVSQDPGDDEVLFTFNREIDSYLLTHQGQAEENSLFIVWIGANNYLGMPEDTQQAIADVNAGIKNGLEKLVNKGAKHIMLLGLPDLGMTPAAIEMDLVDSLSALSLGHNTYLQNNLKELQDRYPSVQWLYFDINNMMHEVIDNPDKYGFTNTTESCYQTDMAPGSNQATLKMVSKVQVLKETSAACEGYLFFDLVHPSTKAHQIMADNARRILDAAQIEFAKSD